MSPEPESSQPPAHTTVAASALDGQPIARIRRDGTEYVLLGTAHVSRASVDAVKEILAAENFDAVAVELCEPRYSAIQDPEAWRRMDLFQVIRQGKAGLVAANLALAAFQRRIAEQFGIEPGAEMKAAIEGAQASGARLWVIDREIGVTLKRAYRSLSFLNRLAIVGGLSGGLLSRETVAEDEIEKLKEGDMLGSMFGEFAEESPELYEALINERDRYMVARLREENVDAPALRVLVVIGAGHLAGMEKELADQDGAPADILPALRAVPPASRWPRVVMIGILVLVAGAIGYAFTRGASLGTDALWSWILFTGGGAALGALAGGGHVFSVLAAFIAGPLKPFRPGVPAGAVSAGVEAWWHRPRVADFDSLRDDVTHWTGWWRNRVSRTLLVFMLTNLGMIVGSYVAGFRIIKSLF